MNKLEVYTQQYWMLSNCWQGTNTGITIQVIDALEWINDLKFRIPPSGLLITRIASIQQDIIMYGTKRCRDSKNPSVIEAKVIPFTSKYAPELLEAKVASA